jgi:hypothetical protein
MTMSTTRSEEDDVAVPAESPEEAQLDRRDQILEIISVILLSIATLATSWSGYQATRWSGEQSMLYSQASAMRVESTRASNRAGQLSTVDVVLFGNWLNASSADDEELAQFYADRFRAEFVPAFDAWVASDPLENPDALPSPFAHPEYVVALDQQAIQLDNEASTTFIKGQQANQLSDDYVLTAVLFASVLFFGGIAQRFLIMPIRIGIIVLATAMCILGLYLTFTYPIL